MQEQGAQTQSRGSRKSPASRHSTAPSSPFVICSFSLKFSIVATHLSTELS